MRGAPRWAKAAATAAAMVVACAGLSLLPELAFLLPSPVRARPIAATAVGVVLAVCLMARAIADRTRGGRLVAALDRARLGLGPSRSRRGLDVADRGDDRGLPGDVAAALPGLALVDRPRHVREPGAVVGRGNPAVSRREGL